MKAGTSHFAKYNEKAYPLMVHKQLENEDLEKTSSRPHGTKINMDIKKTSSKRINLKGINKTRPQYSPHT